MRGNAKPATWMGVHTGVVQPPIIIVLHRRYFGLTLTGRGRGAQIVGVADTGIDWDNCFFWESAYSHVRGLMRAERRGTAIQTPTPPSPTPPNCIPA